MPATVPFVGPKKRSDESPRGKEDPNSQTGGAGCGATGRNRKAERPDKGAQDVSKAHEAKQTTVDSSTCGSVGRGRLNRFQLRPAKRVDHVKVAPTRHTPASCTFVSVSLFHRITRRIDFN